MKEYNRANIPLAKELGATIRRPPGEILRIRIGLR